MNQHEQEERLNQIKERILAGRERVALGLVEWIEGTLTIACALQEARDEHTSDPAFGSWLKANGIKFSHQDRAALLGFASNTVLADAILRKTDSHSWRLIWDQHKDQFTSAGKLPRHRGPGSKLSGTSSGKRVPTPPPPSRLEARPDVSAETEMPAAESEIIGPDSVSEIQRKLEETEHEVAWRKSENEFLTQNIQKLTQKNQELADKLAALLANEVLLAEASEKFRVLIETAGQSPRTQQDVTRRNREILNLVCQLAELMARGSAGRGPDAAHGQSKSMPSRDEGASVTAIPSKFLN